MIIKKPVVTEKINALGEKLNQFAFNVELTANKIEIKKAIEEMYNVHVTDVRTLIRMGKAKTRMTKKGVSKGRTNRIKRAIVTLKKGDTIDFYGGV